MMSDGRLGEEVVERDGIAEEGEVVRRVCSWAE